jgi:hypothetical protein
MLVGETSLGENVVRGNVVRGTVVKGNVVRGNIVWGKNTVPKFFQKQCAYEYIGIYISIMYQKSAWI